MKLGVVHMGFEMVRYIGDCCFLDSPLLGLTGIALRSPGSASFLALYIQIILAHTA